jgi:inhibitor of KinA
MALYPETIFRLMGDRGLLLEFGDEISLEINEKVRRMTLATQAGEIEGIVEIVPTYRSLLIIYDPLITNTEDLKKRLDWMGFCDLKTILSLKNTLLKN